MIKRIFRSICFVAFAVFIASLVLTMGVLYGYFSDVQQDQLKMQITLMAQGVSHEGIQYFDQLNITQFRVTWIDADGRVLYDSQRDTSQMENHLERREVREAFSQGYGECKRYSSTLMERSLYCAKLLDDDTVIRLSVTQHTVLTLLLGMAQPICIIVLVAVSLSVALAVRLSKKIVKPLNELDLNEPLIHREYNELSPLLERIAKQQAQLRLQEELLQQKQTELDTVIGNMKEGMLLLNQHGRIISMNPSAETLLNTNSSHLDKTIFNTGRDLGLQEIFIKALEGEQAGQTVLLHGRVYQVNASPILSDFSVSGVAVLLLDVTEKEKAEQMRQEFTANVSHELKTPLHVISGYAELLQNGMAQKEDTIPFAGKIYTEARRMIQLVEDIISLSHLDGGAADMEYEDVDLYALAETVIHCLEPQTAGRGISMELSGGTATIYGIRQLLHSIIYNLCDNAIKYNHDGGSVTVSVKHTDTSVSLSVADTGIGIGPEHQERVFERFYRVDKSRSKEVGGTGLGLSIVKHAAKVHHGDMELRSAKGQGTTITILFPVT